MGTPYESDIVAWADEQAALLRSGSFSSLDALNIAEEIEDVGKSEKRELGSRLAVLVAHLLKWQFQPERRGSSWLATIDAQRTGIAYCLKHAPSLKHMFDDPEWLNVIWKDALHIVHSETGLPDFPQTWPWPMHDILDEKFLPD